MKEEWNTRTHAEGLRDYFSGLRRRQPQDESHALGLALTERWLSLMAAPKPEATLIEVLLNDVEAAESRDDAGSGIVDLSLNVRAWARSAAARQRVLRTSQNSRG